MFQLESFQGAEASAMSRGRARGQHRGPVSDESPSGAGHSPVTAKPLGERDSFRWERLHRKSFEELLKVLKELLGGVDNTIRILSLERERPLKQLSAQVPSSLKVALALFEALQSPAESVCLLEMKNLGQAEDVHSLFLSIGLSPKLRT